MTEPQLFDPTRTTEAKCGACGATRPPGSETAPACTVDRDRQAGIRIPRRPHQCLNQIDPSTAPIPF